MIKQVRAWKKVIERRAKTIIKFMWVMILIASGILGIVIGIKVGRPKEYTIEQLNEYKEIAEVVWNDGCEDAPESVRAFSIEILSDTKLKMIPNDESKRSITFEFLEEEVRAYTEINKVYLGVVVFCIALISVSGTFILLNILKHLCAWIICFIEKLVYEYRQEKMLIEDEQRIRMQKEIRKKRGQQIKRKENFREEERK